MAKTTKKYTRIKPNYIKNAQGEVIQVYLDEKTYTAILDTLAEFKKITQSAKRAT